MREMAHVETVTMEKPLERIKNGHPDDLFLEKRTKKLIRRSQKVELYGRPMMLGIPIKSYLQSSSVRRRKLSLLKMAAALKEQMHIKTRIAIILLVLLFCVIVATPSVFPIGRKAG